MAEAFFEFEDNRPCRSCDKVKPPEEFHWRKNDQGTPRWRSRICKVCQNAYGSEWHDRNPGKQREYWLRCMYRLEVEDYDAMFAEQAGVCAICGSPPGKRSLAVDHDHACCPGAKSCGNCIRGLLCQRCNAMLGHFEANRESVLTYLMSKEPNDG